MPYNDKAIEKLIEELKDSCPRKYGLKDTIVTCSLGSLKQECIDCWKQALQQEPDE